MLTYMLELRWNTARIAIETKEWLQLLPNLQHQAENVITTRKKTPRRLPFDSFKGETLQTQRGSAQQCKMVGDNKSATRHKLQRQKCFDRGLFAQIPEPPLASDVTGL